MTAAGALRRLPIAASFAGIAALTTGCSLFETQTQEPTVVETEEPAVVDEVLAAAEPLVGDGSSLPTSQDVFDVLMEAGYSADQIETTIDESPLGNEVPAKVFSVHVEEGCVVAEIREGRSRGRLMPPSESTGTCLLGYVERPEGAPTPSGEAREEGDSDNGTGHLPGDDINGEETDAPDASPSGDGSDGSGESGGDSGSGSDGSSDGDSGGSPGLGGG